MSEEREAWKLIRVNEHFDALMRALEHADSKGYLPDAMREEWENFACDENVEQADRQSAGAPVYDKSIVARIATQMGWTPPAGAMEQEPVGEVAYSSQHVRWFKEVSIGTKLYPAPPSAITRHRSQPRASGWS